MRKLESTPWNIEELEQSLKQPLPKQIKLSFGLVCDVSKFVETHLATIKANKQKPAFRPYLERLQELVDTITKKDILQH